MAVHLEIAQEDRALGKALAENPFPFIIPCHRAIRSEGSHAVLIYENRQGHP
jgi:O6-methylguanine-DNA--protein-cysteine methyltransferase